MLWYKIIRKFLMIYLVAMPVFLVCLFFAMSDGGLSWEDIKDMFIIWLIIYVVWIVLFLILIMWYSIYLVWHKIVFSIDQLFRKIKKKLKIKKKKIWKYPIIIQFDAPKWITSSEIAYLYSMKHFKWNISCLFYKWAAEKRISMDFYKWKFWILLWRICQRLKLLSENCCFERINLLHCQMLLCGKKYHR